MKAVRPHLGAIAARMEEMWNASQLSVSERNVLCDSMLAAAASGGPNLLSQVALPFGRPHDLMGCPSAPRRTKTASGPIFALVDII